MDNTTTSVTTLQNAAAEKRDATPPPKQKAYTMPENTVRRRRVHHLMMRSKRGSAEEIQYTKMLAEIDHAIATRDANLICNPVRSALPKKKQRELGMIPLVDGKPEDGDLKAEAGEPKPEGCLECETIGQKACPEHGGD